MSDLSDGIVQLALDTAIKVPAALTEIAAKVDASRDASAAAHAAHGKKLDEFSGVVTSASAAVAAATATNARLATALEKWEARIEATAAKVDDAATDAEIARKKAEEDRVNARTKLWASVDFWVTRIGGLLAAAWFAHQQINAPAPGTTTTTATSTTTAPADVAP